MRNWLNAKEDLDLFMCLVYGEARGESIEGQIGVACVVRNRVTEPVTWWGDDFKSVILKPYQFSCFNDGDPNLEKIRKRFRLRRTDPAWRQCRWVAAGVLWDWIVDITDGANHYHTVHVEPSWADQRFITATIDRHIFYRL